MILFPLAFLWASVILLLKQLLKKLFFSYGCVSKYEHVGISTGEFGGQKRGESPVRSSVPHPQ